MKVYDLLTDAALFMAILTMVMTGCKYDITEPQWYGDYTPPPTPTIDLITPADSATPGVNTIVITGTNFGEWKDSTKTALKDTPYVYFSGVQADLVPGTVSPTSLTVRRPNLVTDTAFVVVAPPKGYIVAKFPRRYKIDTVSIRWGAFLSNNALSGVAIDNAENLYVTDQSNRKIFKVDADNLQTDFGAAPLGISTRVPSDAKIGPDGNLYIFSANRSIDVMNVQTGVVTEWVKLASGKIVKFGDFDSFGYLYGGGSKSDLNIISPNGTAVSLGLYAKDDIQGVRVYNNYLYLFVKLAGTGTLPKFVRHSISAGGVLGAQEPVLEWSQAEVGAFASRSVRGFTFATNGIMYLVTDSVDPILMVNLSTKTVDILYKGIVPSNCKYFCGSSRHYLYLICGDTTLGITWTAYRIDVGINGAPYF